MWDIKLGEILDQAMTLKMIGKGWASLRNCDDEQIDFDTMSKQNIKDMKEFCKGFLSSIEGDA